MIRYTPEHEWISVDGDVATIGISIHAQAQLGDVVFVEPPEVGRSVKAKEPVAVVESVKAASDIFAPATGEVIARNEDIVANPALVNDDAEGKGWFFKIKLANPKELESLMSAATYATFCASA